MKNPLIHRNIASLVTETLQHSPVTVISGARQVGKSTLMQQLVAKSDCQIVNLDSAGTLAAAQADPDEFAKQYPDGLLAIDELQRAPQLLTSIKLSVDQNRKAGRFIITGSADLLTATGSQESLAGRAQTVHLHGFSQGELHGVREDFAQLAWKLPQTGLQNFNTSSAEKLSRSDYIALSTTSTYPELQNTSPRVRNRWISSYLARVLSKDTSDVSGIRYHDRLEPLMTLLATENASEFVNQRYAEALDLPARSIPAYLQALRDVYLIHVLPAWGHNLSKRAVSKPKVCIADPGIAAYLAGVDPDGLEHDISSTVTGGFLEAFVVAELLKQQGWSAIDYRMFHWRESGGGAEVDIILENRKRQIIAIEVKTTTSISGKHFSGLKKLRDLAGPQFVAGIVLYTGADPLPFGKHLWALPIDALWTGNP